MDKLKMHSPNLTDENVAKIRDLFPSCVTEAKDAMRNLNFSDAEIEMLVDTYDVNRDGKLQYEEFIKF